MSDDVGTAQKAENPYSTLLAILGGGIALALVILAIGVVGGGSSGGGEAGAATVPIELTDFKIGGTLSAAAGDVTLAVSNASSSTVHNLVVLKGTEEIGRTADIAAGSSENLELKGLAAGEYTLFCAIPGHKDAGMTATLSVGAGGGGDAMAGMDHGSGSGGGAMDYAKMDEQMMASFQPFVDAVTSGTPNTKGLGGRELAPKIQADGTKVFNLTAEIVDWEVAPGQKVKAWTYNGTVPRPTIRGEVGDRIKVVLKNKLPMGTDVHMHGMVLPNDQDGVAPITQKLIEPGATFTYEYTVEKPAVAMYH
ncbi:MAG: multicopper oxidase domain-containing protein, partial [Actinomycetes bacterium]